MIFKHFLIGGFLFATACVSATPNIATLEVQPNFDQGLTRKDFRVIYTGVQDGGSDVKIKISQNDKDVLTFAVPSAEVATQKAYYFGLKDATIGKYDVQVCRGDSDCSGKTSSLGSILQEKGKVTCARGRTVNGKWQKEVNQDLVLDISEPGDWLTSTQIDQIENALGGSGEKKINYTEWRKFNVQQNPSYENNMFYVGLNYNMLPYREMFLTKEAAEKKNEFDSNAYYVNAFCERKYLLSLHAHLVETSSKEVKYRFKRTLYMSPGGKQYFIIDNNADLNRQVHVELALEDITIKEGTYMVWISLCTTEKDVVDSTMCSDPVVHTTPLTVSTSSTQ